MFNKIRNEAEFLEVLNRIEKLTFNVVPGSKESDELERLSKMAEEYENSNSIFMRSYSNPFLPYELLGAYTITRRSKIYNSNRK